MSISSLSGKKRYVRHDFASAIFYNMSHGENSIDLKDNKRPTSLNVLNM